MQLAMDSLYNGLLMGPRTASFRTIHVAAARLQLLFGKTNLYRIMRRVELIR
jgi:hypothetical protein